MATITVSVGAGLAGQASEEQKKREREAYHRICDQPPPEGLNNCEEIEWKIEREKMCIFLREKYMSDHDDNYAGHISQINARKKALDKLKDRLKVECNKECD